MHRIWAICNSQVEPTSKWQVSLQLDHWERLRQIYSLRMACFQSQHVEPGWSTSGRAWGFPLTSPQDEEGQGIEIVCKSLAAKAQLFLRNGTSPGTWNRCWKVSMYPSIAKMLQSENLKFNCRSILRRPYTVEESAIHGNKRLRSPRKSFWDLVLKATL